MIKRFNSLNPWVRGLVLAVMGGLVSTFLSLDVDPEHFNFSKAGLIKLAVLFGGGALVAIKGYLAQSPIIPPVVPPAAPESKGQGQ